jgi:predicted nucleic acid-binding protein
MILVDTGYLVALLDSRDQLHERALKWSSFVTSPLIVSSGVIWETVNYFSDAPLREAVHVLIAKLRAASDCLIVHVDATLFASGLQMHRDRSDKQWSLTDCISFIIMRDRGIRQALAYDRHFEQAGFDTMLRREPDAG